MNRASFCLLEGEREKEALPELHQAFEVAAAQNSGLVNLAPSRQTGFFWCEHPFIDKPMIITETTVPSARLLGLSLKLYRSNMKHTLNNNLPRFMYSLS